MPFLEASVSITCPVDRAFDFLTSTANLLHLVPEDLRLSVVNAPPQLTLGSRMEVQILAFGPPQNVTYEITEFSRPERFTETQVKGLLPRYVHEHVLLRQSNGNVLVTDRIEFEPPGGLMGFMLTADRLRTSLDRGLSHRHSALKRLLENS
ncbi:MAG TPA: SRPBCC family protein [Planctomycetaceae bacterium]|nr:SRPBCC family protein [Planctomycetaceae bacterium]